MVLTVFGVGSGKLSLFLNDFVASPGYHHYAPDIYQKRIHIQSTEARRSCPR